MPPLTPEQIIQRQDARFASIDTYLKLLTSVISTELNVDIGKLPTASKLKQFPGQGNIARKNALSVAIYTNNQVNKHITKILNAQFAKQTTQYSKLDAEMEQQRTENREAANKLADSIPNKFQRDFVKLFDTKQGYFIKQMTGFYDMRIQETESIFFTKFSMMEAGLKNYFTHRTENAFLLTRSAFQMANKWLVQQIAHVIVPKEYIEEKLTLQTKEARDLLVSYQKKIPHLDITDMSDPLAKKISEELREQENRVLKTQETQLTQLEKTLLDFKTSGNAKQTLQLENAIIGLKTEISKNQEQQQTLMLRTIAQSAKFEFKQIFSLWKNFWKEQNLLDRKLLVDIISKKLEYIMPRFVGERIAIAFAKFAPFVTTMFVIAKTIQTTFKIVSNIVGAVKFLLTPIFKVVSGIVGAITGFIKKLSPWDSFVDFLFSPAGLIVWAFLGAMFTKIFGVFSWENIKKKLYDMFDEAKTNISNWFTGIGKDFNDWAAGLDGWKLLIKDTFVEIWNNLRGVWEYLINTGGDMWRAWGYLTTGDWRAVWEAGWVQTTLEALNLVIKPANSSIKLLGESVLLVVDKWNKVLGWHTKAQKTFADYWEGTLNISKYIQNKILKSKERELGIISEPGHIELSTAVENETSAFWKKTRQSIGELTDLQSHLARVGINWVGWNMQKGALAQPFQRAGEEYDFETILTPTYRASIDKALREGMSKEEQERNQNIITAFTGEALKKMATQQKYEEVYDPTSVILETVNKLQKTIENTKTPIDPNEIILTEQKTMFTEFKTDVKTMLDTLSENMKKINWSLAIPVERSFTPVGTN